MVDLCVILCIHSRMTDSMPASPLSHAAMLQLWTHRGRLTADLQALGVDVSYTAVQAWETRDNIPKAHWDALLQIARRDGVAAVTEASLQAAVDRRPKSTRRQKHPVFG